MVAAAVTTPAATPNELEVPIISLDADATTTLSLPCTKLEESVATLLTPASAENGASLNAETPNITDAFYFL